MKKTFISLVFIILANFSYSQEEDKLLVSEIKQSTVITQPATLNKGFFLLGSTFMHVMIADKMFSDNGKKEYVVQNLSSRNSIEYLHFHYGLTNRIELAFDLPYKITSISKSIIQEVPLLDTAITTKFKLKGKGNGSEKEKRNPYDIKKYLTVRNILVVALLLLLYILFPKFVQPIVLILVFYPISLFSARTTKYIKFLTTETITPFTIFLAYLYGWQWGVFFGFILGTFIWSQTAMNQLTFVECITYIFAAYFGYLASIWFPSNFLLGYVVAVSLRNLITFIIFLFFNPSLVENISHTIQAVIMNTIIMPIFLNLLYQLVVTITPH